MSMNGLFHSNRNMKADKKKMYAQAIFSLLMTGVKVSSKEDEMSEWQLGVPIR